MQTHTLPLVRHAEPFYTDGFQCFVTLALCGAAGFTQTSVLDILGTHGLHILSSEVRVVYKAVAPVLKEALC